jgi:hypothetical protein
MDDELPRELARAANDRTFNMSWALGAEDAEFLCECGQMECIEHVELTVIEYAAREEGQPLLAPGHDPVRFSSMRAIRLLQ